MSNFQLLKQSHFYHRPMKLFLSKQCSRRSSAISSLKGFTLVEMLVVISIMAVLLTIGSMGLRNLSKATGVSAGVPIAESLFSEARSQAISKGTKTRLLIHAQNNANDEFHRERYLRYMAIAAEKLDDTGLPTGEWEIISKGVSLPQGVYFMKELSQINAPELLTMDIVLPGNSETNCYYYEFNTEGLISKPEITEDEVPRFVIQAGNLPPGKDEPIISENNKRSMSGFVIWRSGRTSLFRSPDQIEAKQ